MRIIRHWPIFLLAPLMMAVAWPAQRAAMGDDRFFRPDKDYGRFPGRVTDISDSQKIFKIRSENRNTKFFRAADPLRFRIPSVNSELSCQAYVRDQEENYFIIAVENLAACWPEERYFRRGTRLNFEAPVLTERVRQAARYRRQLVAKKERVLGQLAEQNDLLWNFDQKKIQAASRYDRKIAAIEKQKEQALKRLISQRQQAAQKQQKLAQELDRMKGQIDFYRVEKEQYLVDRWLLDQDLGLPVQDQPQELIYLDRPKNRYHGEEFR